MLAGCRLFFGKTPGELLENKMEHDVEPPSEFRSEVPRALDDIVMKGLRQRPSERFSSAREMALALEECDLSARATMIGAWVQELAGPALAARADLVAALEVAAGDEAGGAPSIVLRESSHRALSSAEDAPTTKRVIKSDEPEEVTRKSFDDAVARPKSTEPPVSDVTLVSQDAQLAPSRGGTRLWWAAALCSAAVLGAVALAGGMALRGQPEAAQASAIVELPTIELPLQPATPAPHAASAEPTTAVAIASTALPPAPPAAQEMKPPAAHKPVAAPQPKARHCNPPYYYNEEDVRVLKPWCM